jgi:cytochrome P450
VHRAPNTLTLIDKRAHGRKRRIISQGFSDSALRAYEPIIMNHVEKLCAQLANSGNTLGRDVKSIPEEAKWCPPQNMAKWCKKAFNFHCSLILTLWRHLANYLTFDIMSDVIFGEAYNLIEEPAHRHVVEAIERSNVRTSVLIQAAELVTGRLDKRLFKDAILGRNIFIGFVNKLLKSRMNAKPLKRKDVFSFLLGAKDPETQQGLGMAEIGAESTTMIVAGELLPLPVDSNPTSNIPLSGSDTSSTAIASVFFYLTRYPAAYRRVVSEVRSVFSSPSEVTLGSALNSCTYLRACIDESLRLSPPAGSALWREVVGEGVSIDGMWFPSGTEVGTCIHAIHHNPNYYPQPYEYKPERWLSAKGGPKFTEQGRIDSDEVLLAKSAFNPFSIGPRGCIGKGLANVELMLALATLLCRFDFRATEGANRKIGEGGVGMGKGRERVLEFQLFDHVTAAKDGPMVEFMEREIVSEDLIDERGREGEKPLIE